MNESDPDRVERDLARAIETLPKNLRDEAMLLSFPALHNACMEGQFELVLALLDAGVSPDLYPETDDEDDQPPLTWLARDRANAAPNALRVARLLIERSEDVDEGLPLAAALDADDISMVRLLLAAGADAFEARQDVGSAQAVLLDELLKPYWCQPVEAEPRYFVAYDDDQAIRGVGFSATDAIARAQVEGEHAVYGVSLASEKLVALVLCGEEVSWFEENGVAEVEPEDTRISAT